MSFITDIPGFLEQLSKLATVADVVSKDVGAIVKDSEHKSEALTAIETFTKVIQQMALIGMTLASNEQPSDTEIA